jgi:predicted nucleic acid-binding protein
VVLKGLLDTNAALYFLGGRLAESLPGEICVSVITRIELLCYTQLDAAVEDQIRAFLSEIEIIDLTPEVADIATHLRKQHKLKIPDAIIVASAIHANAELLTNDRKLLRIPSVAARRLRLKG